MSNYFYDSDLEKSNIKLREKQCKCSHPSFKCPLCGLYKDNVFNRYRTQIELLENLLELDEEILKEHGIGHISFHDLDLNGIIKAMIEEKRKRYSAERKGLQDEV